MFFDSSVYPFLKRLEEAYPQIKAEYETIAHGITMRTWPETQKFQGSWQVFGFYHNGRKMESCCKRAKLTSDLLDGIAKDLDTRVYMAGFSRMSPGTIILPHIDDVQTEKRIHLGLKVPSGDCRFVVEKTETAWKEGSAFVFDARKEHHGWNKTTEERIVLLVDFEKF